MSFQGLRVHSLAVLSRTTPTLLQFPRPLRAIKLVKILKLRYFVPRLEDQIQPLGGVYLG